MARLESLEAYKEQLQAETAAEMKILQAHIEEQKKAEKAAIKARVTFPPEIFKKALPMASRCEHLRTKAWGDNYATGLKCVLCGKELTTMHEEESQLLGYGSGADPQLYLDVKRHRENEASFRFKNAAELARVEEERIRLEKERRFLELEENYFNDFQDLQAIYEFDHRHAKEIKQYGVFRQGLQWTETELDQYVDREIVLEKLKASKAGLIEDEALKNFDPFSMIENPPPTFRAEDERHKSNYQELKYAMGRLHNYQRKIVQLKDQRAEFLHERSLYCDILHALHKSAFAFDDELQKLEFDLDKTSRLLATYEKMQKLWKQSLKILLQARRDLKKAEMRRVGVWDDVREVGDKLSFIHDETKVLLKSKLMFESRLDFIAKDVAQRTKTLTDTSEKLKEAEFLEASHEYCKPGTIISTRYGDALIRLYREKDHMLMVTLSYGNPPFKAWLNASEIIAAERAKQQAERILMTLEDEAITKFNQHCRTVAKKELKLMRHAEEGYKEFYRAMDVGNHEDSMVTTAVDTVLQGSFQLMKTPLWITNNNRNVEATLKKFIAQRKKDHDTYEGPPSGKPPLLNQWNIFKKRKALLVELTEAYLTKVSDMDDWTI